MISHVNEVRRSLIMGKHKGNSPKKGGRNTSFGVTGSCDICSNRSIGARWITKWECETCILDRFHHQWYCVKSRDNPADIVPHSCSVPNLPETWSTGPKFLYNPDQDLENHRKSNSDKHVLHDVDPEVKCVLDTVATTNSMLTPYDMILDISKRSEMLEVTGVFLSKATSWSTGTRWSSNKSVGCTSSKMCSGRFSVMKFPCLNQNITWNGQNLALSMIPTQY